MGRIRVAIHNATIGSNFALPMTGLYVGLVKRLGVGWEIFLENGLDEMQAVLGAIFLFCDRHQGTKTRS